LNTLVAIGMFIASLWGCKYFFVTLDIDALGYACVAVVLLSLALIVFAVIEDIATYNEYKNYEVEDK